MENKKINLKHWMGQVFDSGISDSVIEAMNLTEDHMKLFDDLGYVERGDERIPPWNIGEIVEVCTSFMIGDNINYVLKKIVGGFLQLEKDLMEKDDSFWEDKHYKKEEYEKMYLEDKKALTELKNLLTIKGLNYRTVYLICRLIKYIELLRGHRYKRFFWAKLPDDSTIENILTMTNRSAKFLGEFGKAENKGVNLSVASEVINLAGFDFNTEDVFFDMKVRNDCYLTKEDVVQQLCCYVLSKRLGYEFKKCVIFNPRWGIYYEFNVEDIPKHILEYIETSI